MKSKHATLHIFTSMFIISAALTTGCKQQSKPESTTKGDLEGNWFGYGNVETQTPSSCTCSCTGENSQIYQGVWKDSKNAGVHKVQACVLAAADLRRKFIQKSFWYQLTDKQASQCIGSVSCKTSDQIAINQAMFKDIVRVEVALKTPTKLESGATFDQGVIFYPGHFWNNPKQIDSAFYEYLRYSPKK